MYGGYWTAGATSAVQYLQRRAAIGIELRHSGQSRSVASLTRVDRARRAAIVADVITPLIAAIGGKPDFASLTFTINHSTFRYGALLNALITFLIIAAVVYFLVVKPMAALLARMDRNKEATERDCPECLSSIPIAARRCKYCTTEVAPAVR